jgi:poly(3-hydroxyalkanoate) synthetase
VDPDDSGPIKEQRPGAAYQKLKQDLKEKIAMRRRDEIMKKDIIPIELAKGNISFVLCTGFHMFFLTFRNRSKNECRQGFRLRSRRRRGG